MLSHFRVYILGVSSRSTTSLDAETEGAGARNFVHVIHSRVNLIDVDGITGVGIAQNESI